ncbi:hypothetical protein [Virgibacillus siamensis]|nr:hypothetical protein [Virgibacillus siamensis]
MKKDQTLPELATFTLLNPDFHAHVDQVTENPQDDTHDSSKDTSSD